jgi:hypothetical protein
MLMNKSGFYLLIVFVCRSREKMKQQRNKGSKKKKRRRMIQLKEIISYD